MTLLAGGGWQIANSIIAKTRPSTSPARIESSESEQHPIFIPSTSKILLKMPRTLKGDMEPNGDHIIIERLEAMTPIHSMEKNKQGHVLAPDVAISLPLMWLWMLAINPFWFLSWPSSCLLHMELPFHAYIIKDYFIYLFISIYKFLWWLLGLFVHKNL